MVVSREVYARDLRRAKEAITSKAQYYATLILDPIIGEHDYILNVEFVKMEIWDEAEGVYFEDEKALYIYFSDVFIEANMYNTGSKHFDGLLIHEMCHLKGFLQGIFGQHHSTPTYRRCIADAGADKKWMVAGTHPGVYSIRHYFGSKNGVVPPDILKIWTYYCPRENQKFVENLVQTMRKKVTTCLNCGDPVKAYHVPPLSVYAYMTDEDIFLHGGY